MSRKPLVRTAAVLLLAAACSAGLAYAAPPAGASSPAAPSSCPAVGFLPAPGSLPAPALADVIAPASVCGCGDAICNGHVAGGACGPHRICFAISACSSGLAAKNCVCITQDPP